VDGRSMLKLFRADRPAISEWRSGYLLEFYGYNELSADSNTPVPVSIPTPEFLGLRTSQYLYVEYPGGFIELYDLIADPYEMDNIAATADKALLAHLSQWLHDLSTCAGRRCSALDQDVAK